MSAEENSKLCPVCGELNACGLSQGKSECWCFGLTVAQEALARIPSEQVNLACICARCAAASPGVSPSPPK